MPAPEWIHDLLDLLPPEKALGLVEFMRTGVVPPDLVEVIEKYQKELEEVTNA